MKLLLKLNPIQVAGWLIRETIASYAFFSRTNTQATDIACCWHIDLKILGGFP
jgi:hypothetical protein